MKWEKIERIKKLKKGKNKRNSKDGNLYKKSKGNTLIQHIVRRMVTLRKEEERREIFSEAKTVTRRKEGRSRKKFIHPWCLRKSVRLACLKKVVCYREVIRPKGKSVCTRGEVVCCIRKTICFERKFIHT